MLSDSEDEKPFIFEEPAITSTFSAVIKQQGRSQAGPCPRGLLLATRIAQLPARRASGLLLQSPDQSYRTPAKSLA